MSILFEAVEPISQVIHHFNRYDEDITDRLNHKLSAIIFCILAIVVTTNQYVGEIIKCWAPAQFPDSWIEYTNSICWISNTYFVPMSEHDLLSSPRKEIVYYQWVPLLLFMQAFLFYLPNVLWVLFSRSTGLDINRIAKSLRAVEQLNPETRDKSTAYVTKHLERSLRYTRGFRDSRLARFKQLLADCGCLCGKRYGNFLVSVYMITKLLYLGGGLLQLYLMQHFLATDYMFYGVEVLQDLSYNGEYKESPRFPRVTLCDFTVRSIGRNQPHTVQCTLPINLFNEKIFIFVWFWLVFLSIANLAGLLYWLWIAFATDRRHYLKTYLKAYGKFDKVRDRKRLSVFTRLYLRQDGAFLLRMISKNTNEVVTSELINLLWDNFCKVYDHSHRKQTV